MSTITHHFKKSDGSEGTRSLMDDFQTLSYRFLHRMADVVGKDNKEALTELKTGLTNYKWGKYEDALIDLQMVLNEYPDLEEDLKPFMDICMRVSRVELNEADIKYEKFVDRFVTWKKKSFLYRFFNKSKKPNFYETGLRGSATKVRCKYCGHYTSYIEPNQGAAYFDTNNCDNCHRGYPVPTFEWDNIDGQAYIFYRGSVSESEFYDEFEEEHDVNPGRDHFMVKP